MLTDFGVFALRFCRFVENIKEYRVDIVFYVDLCEHKVCEVIHKLFVFRLFGEFGDF